MKRIYSDKALKSNYWNEYLETMPREDLDRLHLKRIKGFIKFSYENIPMYKDIYDKAGIKPDDIKTMNDYIEKVPAIDKTDVLRYQQNNPPFGDSIVKDSEDYISLFYMTSGTTGKRMMEAGYYKDILNLWTWKWWAHGIRPTDIFYFAFNFGTFMGFWSAYYDAFLIGAQVISGGGADSKTTILNIMELKPTVLVTTPTYALRLAEVGKEIGINTANSTVRFVSTAGEAGGVVPGIRNAIEKAWGAKALDLYGISELWGCTSWHCPIHEDRLHLTEAVSCGIVLDENGKIVPEGGRGELVFTTYNASIQPLIKYRSHDIVEWYKERCECGRTWITLKGGVLGRTDHMVVIKGTNVYAAGIQSILGEIDGLTDNLEIHIIKEDGGDNVLVKIEPSVDISKSNYLILKEKAENELRRKIGVKIGVEIMEPKSLPRYQLKAKKVFDHRKEK